MEDSFLFDTYTSLQLEKDEWMLRLTNLEVNNSLLNITNSNKTFERLKLLEKKERQ